MDYLKSVKAFILAADKGSFTAAAEAMGITPAMVGKHIRELENRLGYQLIHRTTRRQGLTETGLRFYAYGLQILSAVHEADTLIHHLNEEVSGDLRISAPVAFGNRVLTPMLTPFLLRYPEVNIDLVLTDRRVNLIEERFQIAIRIGNIQDEGLIALPMPPYRMVLAASPSYLETYGTPSTPDELSRHNCISFTQWRSNHCWLMDGPDGRYEVEIVPRLTVDSGDAIREAALSGLGIALNSSVMLEPDILSGKLIRVLPCYTPPARPMHLVRLPVRPMPSSVSAFIEYLSQELLIGNTEHNSQQPHTPQH
ncbi:LysR family transcriptional regulator [Prodigiosinella confusarubida]|uniref:LysR family transcriptional regulator n=1 Tax=Serratia sp. (strain ATCC 39006) TaxID=104623 RepID=A0A2I5TQE7_SERS3|nr:LysR family transcriptional regulator [Serratia sp. ATCC 39006]AUH06786.1 LysR family transcriptional regulator [Serratia sp. ATCC 39006]